VDDGLLVALVVPMVVMLLVLVASNKSTEPSVSSSLVPSLPAGSASRDDDVSNDMDDSVSGRDVVDFNLLTVDLVKRKQMCELAERKGRKKAKATDLVLNLDGAEGGLGLPNRQSQILSLGSRRNGSIDVVVIGIVHEARAVLADGLLRVEG
jgi:hypothetical protein